MKAIIALSSLFIAIMCAGCLGSSSSSTAPTLEFTYVVGEGDNSIRAFAQKSTGDLQALAVSSFGTNPRPVSIALHPSRNFLYVPNLTANTVSGFSIDHTAGVLTPIGTAVPPTPACVAPATCANPVGAAIDSGGHFLFVLNQGVVTTVPASISVFSIDATRGLLTAIAGSPFPFASLAAPNPQFMVASPTSGFLYVSNGASGNISAFSIGSNGVPTEVAGSPFPLEAGATVAGLAIDPKGQFLFAADSTNNAIASFSIAGSGGLTAVAGSPFRSDFGPAAVAVDATSSFLYSANKPANSVSAFKITSGALTQVAGSPFALTAAGSAGPPQPTFLTVDVTNTFLLVANQATANISVYNIRASDGALGLITNSPFGVAVQPLWIVTTK